MVKTAWTRPAASGAEFAFLFGGLVVTEQVFNLNGIGQLFVQSVSRNDFMLIQGMVIMIAGFYVIINLVVDLLYDPPSTALQRRAREAGATVFGGMARSTGSRPPPLASTLPLVNKVAAK